ncbi:MAG TPA: flagellar hook-associated protein FlgK, partial [Candidatus Binataceae bacterium]|nr:flagellar hook-associated protein FlgK [Candidatus Binataceae bacterium]
TEANITNASDPNYSAEAAVLAPEVGADGSTVGVQVLGIQSAQAPFITTDLNQAQSTESYNSSYAQVTQLAQTYLAPASGDDLLQSLQGLFNSLTNLSASPQDPPTREAVLSAASNFATMSQQLSQQFNQSVSNELGTVPSMVQQVNSDSQQIAQLNSQIQAASAGGGDAGALLDQRGALVSDLSNLIGASADANGNVSVAGVPLVSGSTPLTLSTTGSGTNFSLSVSMPNGNMVLPTDELGGTIGGSLSGANRVAQLNNDLNTFVTSVANSLNNQSQQGYGLDGSTNNALFEIGAGGNGIALNPAINEENLPASATAAGVPGDGSNAAAMAELANSTGLDAGFPTSTLSQAYTQLASAFGSDIQNASSAQSTAASSVQSLSQLQSSVTGVSLNQELANLIQYQNALQAAGRALQVVNDNISFLITQITPATG